MKGASTVPHTNASTHGHRRRPFPPAACLAVLVLLLGTGIQGAGAQTPDAAPPVPLTAQQWSVTMPTLDVLDPLYGDGAEAVNQAIRRGALALVAELMPTGHISGDYQVHLNESGLLSITLQYSGFGAYMAHPMHVRTSITADVATGTVYSLADLFRDDRYIDTLSEAVARSLEEWDLPTVTDFEKISPDQPFYLTPTSLVIYFQLYELLPYAAGFPEFEVPYADVADMVAEDGPIMKLMARGNGAGAAN